MSGPQEHRIDSISKLVEVAVHIRERFNATRMWYRGHGVANWHLRPRVFRGSYSGEDERALTNRFRLHAPTRFAACPAPEDFSRWLSLMQHYRLPTRLLDWTESAVVAAYFSVTPDRDGHDGALWVLNPYALSGKPRIPPLGRRRVDVLRTAAFVPSTSVPAETVLPVRAEEIDLRMTVQQSVYTIHGDNAPMDKHDRANAFLIKLVIPRDQRRYLREELAAIGIRRSVLFPDLENLAVELADEFAKPS